MNDRIKELYKEIEREKTKIDNCKHNFGEPFFNAEKTSEAYGYRTVGQGSDVWSEPIGYRDVFKDRWTRKCSICGYEQHTNQLETTVVKKEPKFR